MLHVLIAIVAITVAGCSDDLKKRKVTETKMVLGKMTIATKTHAAEFGAFPIGVSKQLPTPEKPDAVMKGCCGSPTNKCPVSTEWASDPIWTKLGIALTEPMLYRYKYESTDGKAFTITAEGDLDCDGQSAIYTLTGSLDGTGKVTTNITQPVGEY